MKKVIVNYNFIVFLYAYLRQADLSLDRSRWNLWDEFVAYYQQRISPGKVAASLLKETNISYVNTINFLYVPNPNVAKAMLTGLIHCFYKKVSLTEKQIQYCCQILYHFEELLHTDIHEYTTKAEQLRIDIAKFYSGILEYKLSTKDRQKIEKIEHFLENFNITTVKLDEIITNMGIYIL